MTKPESNVIDDIMHLAGGAMGLVSEMRQSIHSDIKERVEQTASNLDLVPRADFERLELLVQTQQKDIDTLKARMSKTKKKTQEKEKS